MIDVREMSEIEQFFPNRAAYFVFFLWFSVKSEKIFKMSRCDSKKRVQLRNQGEPDFNVQVFGVIESVLLFETLADSFHGLTKYSIW